MAYGDDVKFEGDQSPMGAGIGIVAVENKMAQWLIRKGFAKTQTQAQYILLGVAVGAFLIGIGAWFLLNNSDHSGQTYKSELLPKSVPNSSVRNF